MGCLVEVVSGLEEEQAEAGAVGRWADEQAGVVKDWKLRPSKLRAEPARAELAAIAELLGAVADRNNKMAVQHANNPRYQPLVQKLSDLEQLILETQAKKSADEGLVDDYRKKVAASQGWLDSIGSRVDALTERGGGTDMAAKLAGLEAAAAELQSGSEPHVEQLKKLATDVSQLVSNLDAQQIDDQVKSVERRYKDAVKRVNRKLETVKSMRDELEAVRREVDQARAWVQQKNTFLSNPPPLGFEARAADDRIQLFKALLKEAEGKQVVANSAERRLTGIAAELEPSEVQDVEHNLHLLESEITELIGGVKQAIDSMTESNLERRQLENKLDSVREKLKALTSRQPSRTVDEPLLVTTVERWIADNKDYKGCLKKFREVDLAALQKQANTILKECDPEDQNKLSSIINGMSGELSKLEEGCDQHAGWLEQLLGARQRLEAALDRCTQWINQAEVTLSADVRTSSIPLIQEQLNKAHQGDVDMMNDKMKELVAVCDPASRSRLEDDARGISEEWA